MDRRTKRVIEALYSLLKRPKKNAIEGKLMPPSGAEWDNPAYSKGQILPSFIYKSLGPICIR
jgi:hypothetical protein